MADNAHNGNDAAERKTDEAALSARLRRLGDQLGHQRPGEPSEEQRGRPVADASGYARGFRLSSELVAGVLVGAAVGWALDRMLGISPWGLIVFLLLGFAAGVVNVMRAAGVAPERDPGATSEG
jgi:ATP synthase protein I